MRFELAGNGDWQTFSLRFRAPRFDEGFNKIENAFGIEARTGTDVRRNVIIEKPSPGARWDGEDCRGPAFMVVAQGPFRVRNSRHDAADFAQLTLPKASGGDTNEKDLKRSRRARQGDVRRSRLRGLPPGRAQHRRP